MFRNLLKTSFRSIKREKGYSAINILGLTIGITCCLFLLLYILDELSYDKYHENAPNLYRVVMHVKEPDNEYTWARVQIPLAEELSANYPDVVSATRFFTTGRELFQSGALSETASAKQFYEEDFYYADSSVFDMFSYEFLAGNSSTALDDPFSVVLSESMALKYFDSLNVMGKMVFFTDRKESYKVTGVMKDVPHNSHFHFDALMSVNSLPQFRKSKSWGRVMVYTYIQLPDQYNPVDFKPHFDTILSQHLKPLFEKTGMTAQYDLQRITDIHLHSKIQDEVEAGGNISTIYIFSAIAFFILIIACINYMNLATARSAKRAREVGIRKVMGSFRGQLIVQFLTESLILSTIALASSLLAIYLLLPLFNLLTTKELGFDNVLDQRVLLAMVGILLLTGIVGGSYPAFYLSKFEPVAVLKGKMARKGGTFIRKTLVVLQFSISIFMLIATLVVYSQLRFLMQKDLGFDKEQMIRIPIDDPDMRKSLSVFKNELINQPGVKQVATASATPGEDIRKAVAKVEVNDGTMAERGTDWYAADYDYKDALGLTIAEGRYFSRDILSDTALAVLVNEAMVKRMNWDEPLGKKFQGSGPPRKVIGVIKDYHQNSLYDEIEPMVILFRRDNYYTYIKVDGQDMTSVVASVENAWKEVFPSRPFEYQFLDEAFDAQYKPDQKRGTIFSIFSMLTILIACLGLLGLTAYTTEQRTKEIGIRKIIGASISSIIILISREFVVLVALASVFAIPAAYYFMDTWLQVFAYRIDLNGEVFTFVLSAVLAMLIAILTVGYHSARAARANPVNSLRSE